MGVKVRQGTREHWKARADYAEQTCFNLACALLHLGEDADELEESLPLGWEDRWRAEVHRYRAEVGS